MYARPLCILSVPLVEGHYASWLRPWYLPRGTDEPLPQSYFDDNYLYLEGVAATEAEMRMFYGICVRADCLWSS
jgi:hypothetical protein